MGELRLSRGELVNYVMQSIRTFSYDFTLIFASDFFWKNLEIFDRLFFYKENYKL